MNTVDPSPGQIGERGEVLIIGEPLGLEPSHLAGRCRITLDSLAADHPAHRRITSQPVGVVDVLVSGKTTEHLLAQHAYQIVASIPARATVNQVLLRDGNQAECVIEFAIGQQAGIGSDTRTVELQLEASVEIEPQSIGFGFTRWLRHHCLDPNEIRCRIL